MHRVLASSILIALLVAVVASVAAPISAQEYYDTPPTLVVSIIEDSKYVVLDDSGYGVMTGMVENSGASPVYNVQIQVRFYDDVSSAPVDVVSGPTLIDIVYPNSKTPFKITSSAPHLGIEQASAHLVAFDPAPAKAQHLKIQIDNVTSHMIDPDKNYVAIQGIIHNGPAYSGDVAVHVAFHDTFVPPRTLDVATIHMDDMAPGQTASFELGTEVSSWAHSMTTFAESDVFLAAASQQKLPQPATDTATAKSVVYTTMVATITDVSLRDEAGARVSSVPAGQPANIRTGMTIQLADERQEHETPYTLYVQIRGASEGAPVEFVDSYDGRFVDQDTQVQSIDWVPQTQGLYIAETFVWDRNNVPIAERGPVLLILVEE